MSKEINDLNEDELHILIGSNVARLRKKYWLKRSGIVRKVLEN